MGYISCYSVALLTADYFPVFYLMNIHTSWHAKACRTQGGWGPLPSHRRQHDRAVGTLDFKPYPNHSVFVLGIPINSSATPVNSQLVCLWPVGILTCFVYFYGLLLSLFVFVCHNETTQLRVQLNPINRQWGGPEAHVRNKWIMLSTILTSLFIGTKHLRNKIWH